MLSWHENREKRRDKCQKENDSKDSKETDRTLREFWEGWICLRSSIILQIHFRRIMEKTSKVQEPKLFFSAFSAFRAARASRERLDWRCSATADTETPSPQPRSGSPWPPARRPGRLGAEAAQGGARKGFQVEGTSSMAYRSAAIARWVIFLRDKKMAAESHERWKIYGEHWMYGIMQVHTSY